MPPKKRLRSGGTVCRLFNKSNESTIAFKFGAVIVVVACARLGISTTIGDCEPEAEVPEIGSSACACPARVTRTTPLVIELGVYRPCDDGASDTCHVAGPLPLPSVIVAPE